MADAGLDADETSTCQGDIAVKVLRDHPFQNRHWGSNKKGSDIYHHFVTEFVSNRETENRGFKKCRKVIKCSGNTSNMKNHYQNCNNKTTTVLPTGQQTLSYATSSKNKKRTWPSSYIKITSTSESKVLQGFSPKTWL